MFGVIRAYLALIVAVVHLRGWPHFTAGYAVFAFYMISGYLMTLTLHSHYGFNSVGFRRYIVNRFLRIYPPLYVASVLTLLLIYIFGENSAISYRPTFTWPADGWQWLQGITNFYWRPEQTGSHLVPPSWAVAVEFLFYILLGLGIAKNRAAGALCLMVGIVYHAIAYRHGWDRYYSPLAAALPYGLGVLAYFAMRDLRKSIAPTIGYIVIAAYMLAIQLMHLVSPASEDHLPLYVNMVVFFPVLVIAGSVTEDPMRRLDVFCGGLAYPIYLLHYPIGLLVSQTYGVHRSIFIALPLLLAAAFLLDRGNALTIEKLRQRVRLRHVDPLYAVVVKTRPNVGADALGHLQK